MPRYLSNDCNKPLDGIRKNLTALLIVVVVVAVAIADASDIFTVLDHVDGDIVVFHTIRFGVDAGEHRAAVVVIIFVFRTCTGAGAAIATIVTFALGEGVGREVQLCNCEETSWQEKFNWSQRS